MRLLPFSVVGSRRVGRVGRKILAAAVLFCFAYCTVSGLPTAAAAERVERRLTVGGMTRSYIAYLPDGHASRGDLRVPRGDPRVPRGDPRVPRGDLRVPRGDLRVPRGDLRVPREDRRLPRGDLRVLIAYHPALGDGAFMERSSELHEAPGAENFIVVYPDGVRRTWNAGDCCGPAENMNVDDLAFFDAMMADLSGIASIRPQAYVTGYSNGALMAYWLVCKRPDRIAAAAPFAAYPSPEALRNCPSGRVPLMHIHGNADDGAPVEGGMTSYLGFLPPVSDTVDAIARRNGCNVSQTSRQSVPELDSSCVQYKGCAGGAETELCIVPGLGHSWPGMSGRRGGRFGPARPELEGSEAIIDFFLRH